MSETVTIDKVTAAQMVAGHLNHIHDDGTGDDEGCCPDCCAPCSALRSLRDSGQLDEILRGTHFAAGWSYWDDDADQVDRKALERAWRMEDCHSLIVLDVDGVEYQAEPKRGEDRTFWCEVEGLPGCCATGRTIAELTEAATEAVRMCTSKSTNG